MSNVVPFRRKTRTLPADCSLVAVADDLLAALDAVQGLVGRAASMDRPAIEVERTVQNLLDAVSALERAVDCIGEGGEGGGEGSGPMPA